MTNIPLPVRLSESDPDGIGSHGIPLESVVSMVRDSREPGGRDRFACSLSVWTLLLQVAESFGWKPRGTSYSSSRPAFIESAVRHDYQPGDARDQKLVEVADAVAWAMALKEARDSPHLLAMLNATSVVGGATDKATDIATAGNAPFEVVMDEFIAYAFGGAFSFAREG